MRKVLYKEMLTARNYFVGRWLLSWQSHLKLISRCRQYIHSMFCAVVVVVFVIIGIARANQPTSKKTKGENASQIKLYHHYTQREALWSLYFFLLSLIKIYTLFAFRFSHSYYGMPFYSCKIGFVWKCPCATQQRMNEEKKTKKKKCEINHSSFCKKFFLSFSFFFSFGSAMFFFQKFYRFTEC